jgi:hypothetical protein
MTVVAADQVAHQRVFLVDSRGHLVSPAARQAEPAAVAAGTFREQQRAVAADHGLPAAILLAGVVSGTGPSHGLDQIVVESAALRQGGGARADRLLMLPEGYLAERTLTRPLRRASTTQPPG